MTASVVQGIQVLAVAESAPTNVHKPVTPPDAEKALARSGSESNLTQVTEVTDLVTEGASLDEEQFKASYESTITTPSRRRRRSSIKQFNPQEIPLQSDKRCVWKQLPKPDLVRIRSVPVTVTETLEAQKKGPRRVRFDAVEIRAFDQTLGDNPSVSYGPPIGLDWQYQELEPIDLDVYEANRSPRRNLRQMMLNYYQRRNLLTFAYGFDEQEWRHAMREANRTKRQRAITKFLLPAQFVEQVVESSVRKTKRLTQQRRSSAAV